MSLAHEEGPRSAPDGEPRIFEATPLPIPIDRDEDDEEYEGDGDGGADRMYGTFVIGDKAFTLPAKEIREVVAYTDQIAPMPRSPSYVAGVFCLRGEVLPVIDAANLLGLHDGQPHRPGESRIAVIDCGERCAGMIFESTSEVMEVDDDAIQWFEKGDGSHAPPLVTGIVKLDGGERLVQILSGDALSRLEGVPWGAKSQAQEVGEEERRTTQMVVASVGDTILAIDVAHVLEIHEDLEFTQQTAHLGSLSGTVQLRGMTVFVMDLHHVLTGRKPTGVKQRMVFVHDAERVCALLVDRVLDVVNVENASVVELKALREFSSGRFFSKVVTLPGDREALFLDILSLFRETGFNETPTSLGGESLLAGMESGEADGDEEDGEDHETRSFLTFELGQHSFCLDLTSIQEIQEFPEHLLSTPGLDGALVGIMSLRGSVVPIIDLRVRYGVTSARPASGCKVIILPTDGELRGFLVDALVGIHHITDPSLLESSASLGPLIRSGANTPRLQAHIRGGVHLRSPEGSNILLVLDPRGAPAAAAAAA